MNCAHICYIEIPAPDVKKAASFYSSVFGWKVSPSNLSDQAYWMFESGEGQLSGGFDSTKLGQASGIIVYLKVEDISATLSQLEEKGGVVVRPKFDIGAAHGFSAIFRDPNGNHVGLWSDR